MSEKTNEELAAALAEIAVAYEIEDREHDAVMVQEAIDRLRQQSEDSARLDALHAMVNGNVDGVEIRQDFAGPGQCLIVNCQNFYGPDMRAVIDKARKA